SLVAPLARRGHAGARRSLLSIVRVGPARSPRSLDRASEGLICDCRRKTGRFGPSRPPRQEREPANRYHRPCPADLPHTPPLPPLRPLPPADPPPNVARGPPPPHPLPHLSPAGPLARPAPARDPPPRPSFCPPL